MKGDQFGYFLKTVCLLLVIYYGAEPFMNYMLQPFEWGQIALGLAVIAVCWLILKTSGDGVMIFRKEDEDGGGRFSGRAKADNLRRKIAQSKDMAKQKQMAYEAAQSVYGTSKPLRLSRGDVVGVINGGYYVFKPRSSDGLQAICTKCISHMLDESYSNEKMGEHANGGEVIAGGQLSPRDYAGMRFMQMRMGTCTVWAKPTRNGMAFGQKEEKYKGGSLHCEVNYKCKPIAK